MDYSNKCDVRVGDMIKGEGFITFQDGFKIDRTPIVEVREHNGRLYAGGLSFPESFGNITIIKRALKTK